VRAAIRGIPPIIRSDGTPLRDYVYVEDAVDAYTLLAEALVDGRLHGEAINVSYERPLSVSAVVEAILAEAGVDLEPVVEGTATHEIQDQYLDASLARDRLGWTPTHEFAEGLRRTIAWYREHLDRALSTT
jgi:CDP-glucose 4,6-dehydratase